MKKTATFIRLKTGEWGLRGAGLVPGLAVTVRTRTKATRRVVVDSILSDVDGVQLATINASAHPMTIRQATGAMRDRGLSWAQIRAHRAHVAALAYSTDYQVTCYIDSMISDEAATKARLDQMEWV